MKKSKGKGGMSGGAVAAIGASAVALGATAYYFLGPKAKAHQKKAKKWTLDAKKKIIEEIQEGRDITEAVYGKIVDNVVEPYMKKSADAAEVMKFAQALKKDWKHIVKVTNQGMMEAKKAKGQVKRAISKGRSIAGKAKRRVVKIGRMASAKKRA